MDIEQLKIKLRQFSKDRDWEQFHNPKNLAMALSVEASELVEIFQWLNEKQSSLENMSNDDISRVSEEIADILIYLVRISDKLNINIEKAIVDKMKLNDKKYPIHLSKGNSIKYNRR